MKKGWIKWVNLAAVGVTLVLIGVFFWHNTDALSGVDWVRMSASIPPTLLLYGLSLALQAAVWIGVVSGLIGVRWGTWDVVTYLETHLVRRLPGLPWYMASRAALYQDRGANGAAAALTASALEWLGTSATATIWIVAGFLGAGWALIPVMLVPAVFALVPWLSHRERLPERLRVLRHLSPKPIVVALGVYACVWVLAGLIVQFVVRAVAPDVVIGFETLTATWSLSAVVSMLTVFAPAGLGIRELTLVAQLQPVMGVAKSTLVALLIRVLFTIGDVLFYALAVTVRYLIERLQE